MSEKYGMTVMVDSRTLQAVSYFLHSLNDSESLDDRMKKRSLGEILLRDTLRTVDDLITTILMNGGKNHQDEFHPVKTPHAVPSDEMKADMEIEKTAGWFREHVHGAPEFATVEQVRALEESIRLMNETVQRIQDRFEKPTTSRPDDRVAVRWVNDNGITTGVATINGTKCLVIRHTETDDVNEINGWMVVGPITKHREDRINDLVARGHRNAVTLV